MSVRCHRACSIYGDEPMSEFLEWLQKEWGRLSPTEKANAKMEARPVRGEDKLVMVGFKFTEDAKLAK